MPNFFTISKESTIEYVIEKSKFIAFSFKVESEEQIKAKLSSLEEKFKDATHICYAYDLMSCKQKCSDNGEPSGTAGKPILDCIQKQGLKNILVAVVRYFGGIKLGAGGLVRAYSHSASLVIENSKKRELKNCAKLKFNIQINELNKLDKILNKFSTISKDINFSQDILVEIIIENEYQKEFISVIENTFNRKLEILENINLYYW